MKGQSNAMADINDSYCFTINIPKEGDAMSKRFTNTEKWIKKWFRNLSPKAKLLFLYIIDVCDTGGFYEIDYENIEYFTKLSQEDIKEILDDVNFRKDCEIKDGWLWVRDFTFHQKNYPLNESNNYHKQIIRFIKEQSKRFPDSRKLLPNYSKKGKIKEKIPFNKFWELYDKKVGSKTKIKKKWDTLPKKIQEEILQYIPKYIENQPNKQYRKNPDTFFNNQSWEDELVSHNTNTPTEKAKKYKDLTDEL